MVQLQGPSSPSKKPAAPTLTYRWASFPVDAQSVLTDSFQNRQKTGWIWNQKFRPKTLCADTEQCFNLLEIKRRSAFRDLYDALKAVKLWKRVKLVTNIWSKNVRGFDFIDDKPKDLIKELTLHHNFCYDTRLGGSQHSGVSWRQVVSTGTTGIHITVRMNKKISLHLDRISPVLGKESSGACRYSMRHVLPHVSKELWGWPVTLYPPLQEERVTTPPGRYSPVKLQNILEVPIPGT